MTKKTLIKKMLKARKLFDEAECKSTMLYDPLKGEMICLKPRKK